tara:strand:+ start:102 stop:959 length:858 start_codon:yes stop_codon:yes gene_type:complete
LDIIKILMIIWIASYPKSGNTWLRSIITSLLYTTDGIFDFKLIKKIKQFPTRNQFQEFTKNFNDINEISKFWLLAQDKINLTEEIKFFKTHNLNCAVNKNSFTNKSHTLGTIYVVRDPRNLVNSIKNHYNKGNDEEAKNFLISKKILSRVPKDNEADIATLLGSWSDHYNFWTKKNSNLLLIKYEDLILDTKKELERIIIYLKKFMTVEINPEKIKNILSTTSFDHLKNLENKGLFNENVYDSKKNKIRFFNKGPSNDWTKVLDKKIQDDIEKIFYKEMKELGYI